MVLQDPSHLRVGLRLSLSDHNGNGDPAEGPAVLVLLDNVDHAGTSR
jgi:hypothetical protein